MPENLELGENIEFSIKRRFGLITINRPGRANALTLEMLMDLKKVIEFCQNSEKIRGLIMTGTGKDFTTGLDLNSIQEGPESSKAIEGTASEITHLLYNGKPAICAINGKAMGDGVMYALSCDYRIAVREAYFQMPEVNFGIFPGTGCVVLMTRIIGIPWTRRMLMFAERVNSEQALEIGLVDEIVDNQDELMKKVMEKVKFLFPKNQTVVNAIKLCSNHLMDKSYKDAYELEKLGSSWYEYEDKDKYIQDFRKKFY